MARDCELQLLIGESNTLWVRLDGICEKNGGSVRDGGISLVVSDISESKLSELSLAAAREAADNVEASKSKMLARLSHELLTPMHAILGFTELLQLDGDLTSEYHRNSLDLIYASGTNLLELLYEIRDQSDLIDGHTRQEAVSLERVFDDCLMLARELRNDHNIEVSLENAPPAALGVMADYTRLKEVLLNLLSNEMNLTPTKEK